MKPIVYRLDKDDRLVGVNAEWDLFAGENGGPSAALALDRPIWDFIADDTTRELYAEVLKRARGLSRNVSFPLRLPLRPPPARARRESGRPRDRVYGARAQPRGAPFAGAA